MPTPEQVLEALKKVRFPGLSRDIVSFGFVRDVKVDGASVSFTIHFSTENPNVGQQLSRDSEAAVRALDGVGNVRVNLEIAPRQSAGPAPVRHSEKKVGRNDPCPCGSGKKYKKCHGLATV